VINIDAELEHDLITPVVPSFRGLGLPKNAEVCNLKHIFIAVKRPFRLSCIMSKLWMFLKYWLPTIVWMVLIFSASADSHSSEHTSRIIIPLLHWLFPHISDQNAEEIHHLIRKCAHLTEYAFLALLVRRTLNHTLRPGLPPWSWRLFAGVVGIVFLYASSDEFHQAFVPTRTPLFSDVLIDTSGGIIGLFVAWLRHRVWEKRGIGARA